MTVDWNRYRNLAKRQIDKYGRPCKFVRTGGPDNPDDPLGDHTVTVEVSDVMCCFVSPTGLINLGIARFVSPGLLERSNQIGLVLPSLIHDFKTFTEIVDEGKSYKIEQVDELKPGPVPVLLYVGVTL